MMHRSIVNILMLLWALCVTRVAFASSFADEVAAFDFASLATACAAGVLGGALRTIFTLANDNRVVFSVLKEARKDLVVACIAGGFAYVALVAIESKWPGTITREIRLVAILAAGWTRSAIFTQTTRLARAKLDSKAHEYRNGAPPEDPPASAAVPLETTK